MTKTVLIVEDNRLTVKLFSHLLSARGYKTLHAGDGLDALIVAREHRPDLVLMDIELPGATGVETMAYFKQEADLRDIPIVAITAFASHKDERAIRQSGCAALLLMPVTAQILWRTVDRLLSPAAHATDTRSAL